MVKSLAYNFANIMLFFWPDFNALA